MFTLVTDKSKFYRVKNGQTGNEIEKSLDIAARCAFDGAIIRAMNKNLRVYTATVGDTYLKLAKKFKTDEKVLKELNGDKPIYPTCKLFVPCE